MPNIVCLIPDQWRHDLLGCVGRYPVHTPNLDALAAGGVRLNRCYTVQPMCMATRATWFTGRTPRGHGVRCNGIPLDPRLPTMPEALRQAGWRTHAIGKLHLNPWMPQTSYDRAGLDPAAWPEAIDLWADGRLTELPRPYYGLETAEVMIGKAQGHYRQWALAREPAVFDLVKRHSAPFESVEFTPDATWRNECPPELHPTAWAAERAEAFLDAAAGDDRPFFLWLSIPDPHPPYTVAEPYYSLHDPAAMPPPQRREGELDDLPPHYRALHDGDLFTAGRIRCTDITDDQLRQVQAVVCGMCTQWDTMVGRVVQRLRDRGLYDDTLIVFMSDHGQMLGDHWLLNMPPTHLDGVARVPGIWHWPAGFPRGVVTDALASHLDFAPTVLDLAGVPIPEGAVPPVPEAANQPPPWPGRSLAALLRGDAARVQDSVIIENDADYLGLRQRTIVTDDWHLTFYPGHDYGELFDLRADPAQLDNLWESPAHRDTRRDLLIHALDRFAATDSWLPRRLGHA